jgi:hypothetical protein
VGRYAFSAKSQNNLMESLLCVKFSVSDNGLVAHPIRGNLFKVVQTMPVAVLVDNTVENQQAPGACGNRGLAVWLLQGIPFCAPAIADAWPGYSKVRWVNSNALVPTALTAYA